MDNLSEASIVVMSTGNLKSCLTLIAWQIGDLRVPIYCFR